jgi:hypothetical protein
MNKLIYYLGLLVTAAIFYINFKLCAQWYSLQATIHDYETLRYIGTHLHICAVQSLSRKEL